ncbi:MAG: hypothetical protein ABL958_01180 [Bdellovibrionia bacterium]
MKLRSDLHIARRVWHVCGVLFVFAVYSLVSYQVSLGILVAHIAILVPLDMLRTRKPWLNRIALNWFDAVLRSSEVHRLSGLSYLLFGMFIIIYAFPPAIVKLSILMLAVGDPTSSVVGILYGRDKIIGNKSLQGALGGFAACTFVSLIYFLATGLMVDRIFLITLLSGIIGMLSEVVPVGRLDDNLTFPVISSTLLWGLFYLFGGFT